MNRTGQLPASQGSAPPVATELAGQPARSDRRWDGLNLVAVALLTLAVRWQCLTVPIFDVDEAEFMASAAYAKSAHQSAFSYVTLPYTIAVYKLSADWFGPYNMLPLRIGTLLLVTAVAGLVYVWIARETSRWCGLLAATSLSVYSMYFNGFMANREWPCVLSLVAGAWLFVRSQRAQSPHERRLLFASGLVTGTSLFFKEQAAFVTQAIPLWLMLQAACHRRLQPWLGKALMYAGGGLTAGLIYMIPFLLNSTLLEHLRGELRFGSVYAYAAAPVGYGRVSQSWLEQFFLLRVAQMFLWVGYLSCCRELLLLARRMFAGTATDRRGPAVEGSGLLLTCYVIASMAAVSMGGRFFTGYFLLWLPFILMAAAQGLYCITRPPTQHWGSPWLWLVAAMGYYTFLPLLVHPVSLCLGLLTAAFTWWEARRRQQPWRVSRWVQGVVVWMLLVTLAFEVPDSQYAAAWCADLHAKHMPSLQARAFFSANARRGDRLFVWGCRPEIYCISGLEPASRATVCGGLVGGTYFEPAEVEPGWAAEVLQELRLRQPRFIVVGPAGTKRFGGTETYALDRFPALADLLDSRYRRTAHFSDCDVFERRVNGPLQRLAGRL